MALTGEVEAGKAVLRSTARAGDLIAVTGTLGGSFPTGHHLSFMPRVREGGILAASGVATSMMDLSDGLGTDLPGWRPCLRAWVPVFMKSFFPCARGSPRPRL